MKTLKKFFRNHDEFCFAACSVLIIAAIAGSIYGYVHHVQTKARNQAIARAKQMDGRTYMINNVAWNWIGDTKLILKNEQGADAGWVMIHFENPLDSKINPANACTHQTAQPNPSTNESKSSLSRDAMGRQI